MEFLEPRNLLSLSALLEAGSAEIHGTVWGDWDQNQQRDHVEPGLAGVTVFLDANANGRWDEGELKSVSASDDPGTAGVDETGRYSFSGLAAGAYRVVQEVPDGYRQTYPVALQEGSGLLSFVEVLKDDDGGIGGLDGASALALSPGGEHVYIASNADDAVAVFARDTLTGQLTFVQAVRDSHDGIDSLDGATFVAVSSDGAFVYTAARYDHAVSVFAREATSGRLSWVQTLRDNILGVDGLYGARSLAFSPDGDYVYAAGPQESAIAVFRRAAATGMLSYAGHVRNGVGGVDGLNGVQQMVVSPDGNHLYATSENANSVAIFSRNAGSGQLDYLGIIRDGVDGVDGLYRAQGIAISADGGHVYVSGLYDQSVSLFTRDAGTGQLTFRQLLRDGLGGVDGLGGANTLTLSPDGAQLYVAAFYDSSVAVFDRDANSGELAFQQVVKNGQGGAEGLGNAWGVAVAPDGQHVYAVGQWDDSVVALTRDTLTGQLGFVQAWYDSQGGIDGLNYPWGAAVSPAGEHVYVAGYHDNSLAVFRRDATSGELAFAQVLRDGFGGVDGLERTVDVAISDDGLHVYVAAEADSSVALFLRNPASGELTYVDRWSDIQGGGGMLLDANAVEISPDGQSVYVSAKYDKAISVFHRDALSGRLTFVENHSHNGLSGAASLAISPDGASVYAGGSDAHSLVVFRRDSANGGLTWIQTLQSNWPPAR